MRIIVLFGRPLSLLGYALLSASQKQHTISMRSNYREWTGVLLTNIFSHLHRFCATVLSSGLARKWTSPWCHGVRWESLLHGSLLCFWFHFLTVIRVFVLGLNGIYSLLFRMKRTLQDLFCCCVWKRKLLNDFILYCLKINNCLNNYEWKRLFVFIMTILVCGIT